MKKIDILKELFSSKAVIFDFDNVIVDSEPFHYEAYSRVFAASGHTIDRDEYWIEWTSRGGGAESEIRRYSLGLDPAEIRDKKDPIYSKFCTSGKVPVFPEAHKILKSFNSSGLTMAIASGSYERNIRVILSLNGLDDIFSVITGKDLVAKTKPDPETYLKTIEKLGLKPSECFAIEDAEKGVISAHRAGMKVITVETEVTRGFDLGDADLKLSGLEEMYSLMMEAGLEP